MTAENKRLRASLLSFALVVLLLGACAEPARAPSSSVGNAMVAPHVAAHEKHEGGLAFIDDDYPRALAEAKSKNVPLFVDAWAPWCHSCLSMREYVLHDPSLMALQRQFVFLAIDTEKESNRAFTSKFQNSVWPTLFVIDASTEKPRVKWGGTATTKELVTFLTDAALTSDAPMSTARAAFIRGNAAVAMGDLARATAEYRDALAKADAGEPEKPRIIEALASVYLERGDFAECDSLASRETANLPHGSSRATVLATAIECVSEAKLDSTGLVDLGVADLHDDRGELLADDRSSLFDSVIEVLKDKNDPRAKALAEEWVTFLEREAGRAKTSESRAVFDAHRVLAYTAAGRPRDAIPMLERSRADFPDDYNPNARLAKVYFDIQDYDHARENIDRAFARVYGPRTLRIAELGARIALAQNKHDDAIAFLRAAVDRTRDLPLTPKQLRAVEGTKKKLSALQAGASSLSAE